MSPLQKTGVQLVAENESGFSATLARATSSVQGFSKSTQNVANSGTKPLNDSMTTTEKVMETVSAKTIALGTAMGNALFNGVQAVVGSITNFVSTGIQAVSALQDVQINLETLAAREILYSGVTDNMNEALAKGIPIAAVMMESLKNLSIQSPFQYQQIMEVFQMNMAFGQSSDMALELTRTITNLGAVNKGIPGILQRLAYNFSQMSMVGQITSRDVRDLAMAGLDLKKVLDLQLGMTMEQVNEKLKSGEMTFKDVAMALTEYTDKYVGPAAARASRTLGGLASTFKDVMFFASANLLKPAAENVTVALGSMLDALLALVNSNAFQMIGALLEVITRPLKSFGEWMTSITTVTRTSEETLAQMPEYLRVTQVALENEQPMAKFLNNMEKLAQKMIDYGLEALEWGINIVTQFASGIIQATGTVLSSAMNYLGQILSSWLSPGSPPKVAPDLDVWGMKAMGEYLQGFTEADYSILKSIQQPLEQAMQYAVSAGTMTSEQMNTLFASISRDLVGTINTGEGMEDMLTRIGEAAGPFAQEVIGITQTQFSMAAATQEAVAAQERLTKAQKDYVSAGSKVSKGVAEYNKLLKEGASKEVLQAKMAQINADRQAQKEAAKGITTAQTELQTASENIGTLQQSLSLQQQMLQVMTELARQTITTPEPEKGAGGAGKAAAGTAAAPTYSMPEMGSLESALTSKLEAMKETITTKLKEMFKPVTDMWDKTIVPAINKLKIAWDGLQEKLALLQPKIQEIKNLFATWWAVLQQVWGAIVESLQPAWDKLTQALGTGSLDWKTIMDTIWAVVLAVINGIGWLFLGLVSIIVGVVDGIVSAFTIWMSYTDTLNGFITDIWNGICSFFTGIWDIIAGIFTLNGERIWTGIQEVFSGIWYFIVGIVGYVVTYFVREFDVIYNFIKGFIEGVIAFFQNLFDNLVGNSIIPDMLQQIHDAFFNTLSTVITTVSEKIQAIIDTISGFVQSFIDAGGSIIGGLVTGIQNAAESVVAALVDVINQAIEKAKEALGISSPSKIFMEIGTEVDTGMQKGVEKNATTPAKATRSMASDMVRASVAPPRRMAASTGGATTTVTVQFGNVTITNAAEGDRFEARVERAVRKAVGAGI